METINPQETSKTIEEKGWTVIPGVYTEEFIEKVKKDYLANKHVFLNIQKKKDMKSKSHDVGFHTITVCKSHLDLFEPNKTSDAIGEYLGGPYVLNTMSISELVPNTDIYTLSIHRDIRSFQGASKLWLLSVIMLTDSTVENGATWILEKDKNTFNKPDEDYFFKNAVRIEAKKGDVVLFDGNLWHSSGENNSDESRIIMTPVYSRPFIKQQFDYPRAFGPDFDKSCSEHITQLLGYSSRTPKSLNEFYQKDADDRFYKPNQG